MPVNDEARARMLAKEAASFPAANDETNPAAMCALAEAQVYATLAVADELKRMNLRAAEPLAPSPRILQLVFTAGTLTVRGETRIRFIDGLLRHGRPYDFDGHGILADPAQVKSVQLLSEEDVREMGLNIPGDGDQNWRSV